MQRKLDSKRKSEKENITSVISHLYDNNTIKKTQFFFHVSYLSFSIKRQNKHQTLFKCLYLIILSKKNI
jgi:hypothetical protein